MEILFQAINVTVSDALREELQRAISAELGHFGEDVEVLTMRLGQSRLEGDRQYRHCRATVQLRGSGKAVWVDRSHAQLERASLAAIAGLGAVVESALAHRTAEFPKIDEPARPRGAGWAMLGPLLRH